MKGSQQDYVNILTGVFIFSLLYKIAYVSGFIYILIRALWLMKEVYHTNYAILAEQRPLLWGRTAAIFWNLMERTFSYSTTQMHNLVHSPFKNSPITHSMVLNEFEINLRWQKQIAIIAASARKELSFLYVFQVSPSKSTTSTFGDHYLLQRSKKPTRRINYPVVSSELISSGHHCAVDEFSLFKVTSTAFVNMNSIV